MSIKSSDGLCGEPGWSPLGPDDSRGFHEQTQSDAEQERARMLFWTQSSVYEVDRSTRRIRRVQGDRPPTARTGLGWKAYREIQVEVGRSAVILWALTPEGILQTTVTSVVMAVEDQAEDRPSH